MKHVRTIYLRREENTGVSASRYHTGQKPYEDIVGYIDRELTVILKIWPYDLPSKEKPNKEPKFRFVKVRKREYRVEWVC